LTTGPAISILMPTYNSGDFFLEAVDSAAAQLGPDDELLIQDGGSTDGSLEKVIGVHGANPQVKVVSGPDGGQADALNLALARAVNPVVGWLNGDDCYYPGALDAIRRGWLRNPEADLVYGSWTLYNEGGEILRVCVPGQLTRSGLVRTPQIFTGAMYMRASTVREIGGFDRDLHFCMDMDLVARILSRGLVPTLVPETLGGFRWYEGSKTGARLDFGAVREGLIVRKRYAKGPAEHVEAYVFSGTQAIWHLALPLRRSKFYTRLRTRREKAAIAAELSKT
jgi:glycosyltransferase involved in cell wall biosynthesis